MAVNQPERWQQQWDALFGLFQAAAVPPGPLAGIALVERVTPPEQNVFPCVGVMFNDITEVPYAVREHFVTCRFAIVVAVKRSFTRTETDTTRAALDDLRKYVNDGNGNGMSPLLRANSGLPLLGINTCQRSQITDMRYDVLKSDASSADTIATAIYTYHTEDHVRF